MIEISFERSGPGMKKAMDDILAALPGAIDTAGAYLEAKMLDRIDSGISPPLKPATVKAKGSSKPLYDTGELYEMIDHQTEGLETRVGILTNAGDRVFIGAVHEFGAPAANIPERSFERSTFAAEKGKLIEIMKDEIRKQV